MTAKGAELVKPSTVLTTSYVYDGLQAVEERQAAGPVTTNLAGGLDEVFVRQTGAAKEFLLTDALGSTWGLADNTGNVTTQYKYDVFGTTQSSGATSKNPLQYTGRENDGTGLYYYRNRYYSPKLRRFISRDPLREAAGDNEYAYTNNSPTNFTDPLGLYTGEGGGYNALNDMGTGGQVVSILVDGDAIARDSWTIGNYCAPASERWWAAARMGGRIVFAIFGGVIIGKALGLAGRFVGELFKRVPWQNGANLLNKLFKPAGSFQIRPNGSINTLVNPQRLVVVENHLKDIAKIFGRYNGQLNILRPEFWKHVLPHRHIYDLPSAPATLNANWRNAFQNAAGVVKRTVWPWQN